MAVNVKIPTPLRNLTADVDTYAADPSDLRGIVALGHHADHRLGARRPDDQPPAPDQLGIGIGDRRP